MKVAISSLVVVATLVCLPNGARGEKEWMTPAQMEEISTHIIVGSIKAVYSRVVREGNYEYTRYVAEVQVRNVEKGKDVNVGDLTYVRYFSLRWIGKGDRPPGPGPHWVPKYKKGEPLRIYLARNAYDGYRKDNHDGGFNVIYANGFEQLKGDQAAPTL